MKTAALYVTCWIMGRYVILTSSQMLTKDHRKRVFSNTQLRYFNQQNINKTMHTLKESSKVHMEGKLLPILRIASRPCFEEKIPKFNLISIFFKKLNWFNYVWLEVTYLSPKRKCTIHATRTQSNLLGKKWGWSCEYNKKLLIYKTN